MQCSGFLFNVSFDIQVLTESHFVKRLLPKMAITAKELASWDGNVCSGFHEKCKSIISNDPYS